MNPHKRLEVALGAGTTAAIRALVADEVARALAAADSGSPWLTTEQVAELLGTSVAAIHTRLSHGWMSHARSRDGKRVLIERKALLAELERKKKEPQALRAPLCPSESPPSGQ